MKSLLPSIKAFLKNLYENCGVLPNPGRLLLCTFCDEPARIGYWGKTNKGRHVHFRCCANCDRDLKNKKHWIIDNLRIALKVTTFDLATAEYLDSP